jgi:GT2 family glycosyltransferase
VLRSGLADVVAVVLTHRRPRLAGELVRSLLAVEGLAPTQVVVVVDGDGGLDDSGLAESVRLERVRSGTGPAAGFREGLHHAFADPSVQFAYLCEDDVGLMGLPWPRIREVRGAMQDLERAGVLTGAVVAYGRCFTGRAGVTAPFAPVVSGERLQPVDVAAWGATMVSRRVFEAGVLPDDFWFFAYEDFDFFLRIRAAGLAVMVDRDSGLATLPATSTDRGRDEALAGHRPTDAEEWWRAYYVARNQFEMARRHGSSRWLVWHLLYSLRRLQRARSAPERRAVITGLLDGLRGRSGRNPKFVRLSGEITPE